MFLLLQAVHYLPDRLLIDIEILAFGDPHQVGIEAVVRGSEVLPQLFPVLSIDLLRNHLPD